MDMPKVTIEFYSKWMLPYWEVIEWIKLGENRHCRINLFANPSFDHANKDHEVPHDKYSIGSPHTTDPVFHGKVLPHMLSRVEIISAEESPQDSIVLTPVGGYWVWQSPSNYDKSALGAAINNLWNNNERWCRLRAEMVDPLDYLHNLTSSLGYLGQGAYAMLTVSSSSHTLQASVIGKEKDNLFDIIRGMRSRLPNP